MKEIMAVIRPERMSHTKRALSDSGISSMSATECVGRGKGTIDFKAMEGAQEGYLEAIDSLKSGHRLRPKRLILITVPDKLVKKTIDVLVKANYTGKSGDGKIFVLPVMDSFRVRTGENGNAVLDEE
jgi:nitrogen regulatory protein PII 2